MTNKQKCNRILSKPSIKNKIRKKQINLRRKFMSYIKSIRSRAHNIIIDRRRLCNEDEEILYMPQGRMESKKTTGKPIKGFFKLSYYGDTIFIVFKNCNIVLRIDIPLLGDHLVESDWWINPDSFEPYYLNLKWPTTIKQTDAMNGTYLREVEDNLVKPIQQMLDQERATRQWSNFRLN